MAVTRVVEIGMGKRRSSYSNNWRLTGVATFTQERQHFRRFRISTDDPLDMPGPTMLLGAWTSDPALPEQWAKHPDDDELVVVGYDFEETANPQRWECGVTYGLSINPVDEPTTVKIGAAFEERIVEETTAGAAIVNAAGDIIEGVTAPEPYAIFTLVLDRPVSGPGALDVADFVENYLGCTNSEDFTISHYGTYPSGTLLMADFNVEYMTRNAFEYLHWTHVIHAKFIRTITVGGVPQPQGWLLRLLNAGWRYKDAGGNLLTYRAPDGQPVQSPGLLAADGTKLGVAAAPVFLNFEVRRSCEFSALGLGV